MPRTMIIHNNFSRGVLDPTLITREDTEAYHKGLKSGLNIDIIPHGGITRRRGTRRIMQVVENKPAKLHPFARSSSSHYVAVITGARMDIIEGDEVTAQNITLPYADEEVAAITSKSRLDNLFLFHQNHPIKRIEWQGDSYSFGVREQALENIPNHDYGADIGGQDEIQRLIYGSVSSGDIIALSLEGERTESITISSNGNTTAERIRDALRALSNTSADGINVAYITGKYYEVTFAGDDGKRPWLDIKVTVLKGGSVWSISRYQKGELPGEAVISESRGYPACGAFYGGRLHVGGVKSLPVQYLASKADGSYFNFDISGDLPDAALSIAADNDRANEIRFITAGRHLTIFTSDAEFYIPSEPIKQDAVLKQTTRRGIAKNIEPLESEGYLYFISRDGNDLRQMLYSEGEQTYVADSISQYAPSMLSSPIDAAMERSSSHFDADRMYIINANGRMSALTLRPTENILAFREYETYGKIEAITTDDDKTPYIVVEMGGKRFIDRFDEDALLDGGNKINMVKEHVQAAENISEVSYTFQANSPLEVVVSIDDIKIDPALYSVNLTDKKIVFNDSFIGGEKITIHHAVTEITGLEQYDGEALNVIIDGTPLDDKVTVTSGKLLLPCYAANDVEYGYNFIAEVELLPPAGVGDANSISNIKKRIYAIDFELYKTANISYKTGSGSFRDLSLIRRDTDILDIKADELLFTGHKRIEGILGWSYDSKVTLRQDVPGKFTLLGLKVHLSLGGGG